MVDLVLQGHVVNGVDLNKKKFVTDKFDKCRES